jgi:hypothetical protein
MALLLVGISASARAALPTDLAVPNVAPQTPLEPVAAANISYVDSNGQTQTKPWAALAEPLKRSLLPNAEAFVQIQQEDTSGNFSIVPIGGSYNKGTYRMLFRWQQFRTDYCNPAKPAAGTIRTGVALEIVAEIKTKKAGLNIANLGALTAAAEREKVSGNILIRQIGLGNSSPTLGTYMSNFALTREGVTKALEAIAVTKAVLENMDNKITPYYLSTTESSPGSCASAAPVKLIPLR